ncbi:hypothetical protein BsIDN1_35510 [Bacillus safensis]|uniref:Uncharacterized protein n=1 Tax=Bacillus safensis TaxID=561879 RepID=A0A5S9M9X6_BACIA|nr:hypothetical protein BsIDN1_35510 [Bacillus safensis]
MLDETNGWCTNMYLTIAETAEYLEVSEAYIEKKLIQQKKKIRYVFDGESYLIYQGQFQTHLKQLEQYKELVQEILNEPIPEDPDVKDED